MKEEINLYGKSLLMELISTLCDFRTGCKTMSSEEFQKTVQNLKEAIESRKRVNKLREVYLRKLREESEIKFILFQLNDLENMIRFKLTEHLSIKEIKRRIKTLREKMLNL